METSFRLVFPLFCNAILDKLLNHSDLKLTELFCSSDEIMSVNENAQHLAV